MSGNASNGRAGRTGPVEIPWSRPSIGADEIAEVVETLRSGWLSTGPKVSRLETLVRESLQVEAAFATSSCTGALHVALLAAGIGPGDEVITTSFTFCATLNVIVQVGARPVVVDVEPDTLNIDPEQVRLAVTERTKALLVVHYGGHPCDMDRLRAIAREHQLLLIEDAAHAFGASYRGRPVGAFGDLAAFSFYPNKNMTTGEGGMLVGRADLVERARLLGRHGVDRPIWERTGTRDAARYDVVCPGLKYNMPDIAAAIGLPQLRRLPEFIAERAAYADRYTRGLRDVPGLVLPASRPDVEHAWHLYVVRIDTARLGVRRDEVAAELFQRGIGTSVHFYPVHRHSFYRDFLGPVSLPVTEAAGSSVLSLPCYPGLGEANVDQVVESFTDTLAALGGPGGPGSGSGPQGAPHAPVSGPVARVVVE